MNILHLKYAVEVEKTGSITQAAEKLYMSQPNLSKAIRELENSLGMSIFKRSPKGIVPTKKGQEFLSYARSILEQLEEMESLYCADKRDVQRFSISIPRASYITHAFTSFVNMLDPGKEIDINFSETNSMQAIHNITEGDYNLGIIRYQTSHEKYFISLLHDKELDCRPLMEYAFLALMSKQHPLASKETLRSSDLKEYIEIAHGDLSLPFLPASEIKKAEHSKKHIHVYERGSQFDLLRRVPTTYIWVSPMPSDILECYGLVQKKCDRSNLKYKDLLIYPKGYKFSRLDDMFINELYRVINEITV